MSSKWTADDIPDQHDRVVLVTGANSGIGLEAARLLAGRRATVIIGCREAGKAEGAIADIRATHPAATVEPLVIDVADLASVEQAADELRGRHEHLDVLVNNAGVMAIPYQRSTDGFELHFATNHLGHFALTGRLLDHLLRSKAPRVVTVASTMHRIGQIDYDNLDGARGYDRWRAYGQSKLANLLFAFELHRRARDHRLTLRSLAAHPGWTATNLQMVGPRMEGDERWERLATWGNRFIAQDAIAGALPIVRAATDPDVPGGALIGPGGPGQVRGAPKQVRPRAKAYDPADAARLWQVSEELTGVRFDALPRR